MSPSAIDWPLDAYLPCMESASGFRRGAGDEEDGGGDSSDAEESRGS